MANLGRCMLFYLKYAAEMERLYEAKDPKVEGLSNPDQVLEKIISVGNAASREVAEFLESCKPGIENHFRVISDLLPMRNNPEKSWAIKFWVGPKKATERSFEIGVCIDSNLKTLIPYVWCRSSRRAEDEVMRILGRGIESAKLKWDSGTIGLAEIKIPIPEQLEEPVECDSLVDQVQDTFASFSARDVEAIAEIAGNRGEG